PGNNRGTQGLIAHQSKIGPLNHRATFLAPASVRAVTMGTICGIGRLATVGITRGCTRGAGVREAIGRERKPRKRLGACPSRLRLVKQNVDLLVCQPATKACSEG